MLFNEKNSAELRVGDVFRMSARSDAPRCVLTHQWERYFSYIKDDQGKHTEKHRTVFVSSFAACEGDGEGDGDHQLRVEAPQIGSRVKLSDGISVSLSVCSGELPVIIAVDLDAAASFQVRSTFDDYREDLTLALEAVRSIAKRKDH